jgi:ubiquinol-cytochrome c reductase iron-sulfur subunit
MNGRVQHRAIVAAFAASALASLGLTGVYLAGGQPQIEGLLLAVALGGISAGVVLWAKRFMPSGPDEEAREVVPKGIEQRDEAAGAYEAGAEIIERRAFLAKMLAGAFAALGLAALFPIRSLGAAPAGSLFRTAWRRGSRLVRPDGSPVRATDLTVDGVLTVFPQHHTDAADSQTLLLRLPPGVEPPGPEGWSSDGCVAFSKICTHAGCPVGLYRTETHELFCPCHQSSFAVLQGAKPVAGPATRPLPQLPLARGPDGFLIAQGDYSEPVGPGFWNRGRD